MKHTPLKRKSPLKSKVCLKSRTKLKARTKINPISKKQSSELKLRHDLKAELINQYGEHCMTCKDLNRDWRGITLSHIIPLSRGGQTVKFNCVLECFNCHELYEKQPTKRDLSIYPYKIILK